MKLITIWVLFVSFFLITQLTNSVDDEARKSLVAFLKGLSNNNGQPDPSFDWSSASDPCKNNWKDVVCDNKTNSKVEKLRLDNNSFSGIFNVTALCNVKILAASLKVINVTLNNITGTIQSDIANCKQLTRLHLGRNQFSGNLPDSLAMLSNLKQLDISNNKFSGDLPGLSRISGFTVFLAQNNQLTGEIPDFDFSNLVQFNVSNNFFQGPIPDGADQFPASCYSGNSELCGKALGKKCPKEKKKSKGVSKNQILMYSGYVVLSLVIVALIIFRLKKKKTQNIESQSPKKVASVDDLVNKPSVTSTEFKTDVSRSEISVNSAETTLVSSSLVVLTSPTVSELKFDDMLRAPAELLGRGKHGTLYRVIFENGMELVVKRIKDWTISTNDFKKRMHRLDQAKHPNVLPPLAFYSSKQEKLLVYEYQMNGSLFALLHGDRKGINFEWASRLGVAAKIAEALAFMHQELNNDGIAHGNLKSSNILLKRNMEPCISEYGLMEMDPQESNLSLNVSYSLKDSTTSNAFKSDIYCFGVILLELLTGKLVQNEGVELTSWVHSVVREEWTVEVFDKSLISEGASEERMLSMLQVAIKCVNQSPESRPNINQIVSMINTLKEEEDKSFVQEP